MARSARRSRGFMCVPTFTVPPTLTGIAKVGQTLTCSAGTVINGSVTGSQVLRNGAPIADASGGTYVVQAADIGLQLTLAATAAATRVPANTLTAKSAPTATVIA